MGYVSKANFSFADELARRRKRDAFTSGGIRHPESDAADLAAGLSVEADKESRLAALAEQSRLADEDRAQRQEQFESSQAFNERQNALQRDWQRDEQNKQRKSSMFGGIAEAATSIAGYGILKYFKIF